MDAGDLEVSRITGVPSPVGAETTKSSSKDEKPQRSPALDREELASMWESDNLMGIMVTSQPILYPDQVVCISVRGEQLDQTH